jgi:hypothetical protein
MLIHDGPMWCRYRAIPEHGGRVLRVACIETASDIRILTVFFDRDARKPS